MILNQWPWPSTKTRESSTPSPVSRCNVVLLTYYRENTTLSLACQKAIYIQCTRFLLNAVFLIALLIKVVVCRSNKNFVDAEEKTIKNNFLRCMSFQYIPMTSSYKFRESSLPRRKATESKSCPTFDPYPINAYLATKTRHSGGGDLFSLLAHFTNPYQNTHTLNQNIVLEF